VRRFSSIAGPSTILPGFSTFAGSKPRFTCLKASYTAGPNIFRFHSLRTMPSHWLWYHWVMGFCGYWFVKIGWTDNPLSGKDVLKMATCLLGFLFAIVHLPFDISKAIRLLDQQRGSGGTELLAAIKQAGSLPRAEDYSRSIVLVTDGYVSGERGVFDYIRENLNKSNVFAFGIGTAVNRYLIEGVARAGMGEPFVVTKETEAPAAAAKFRDYIQTPVLTDIQIKTPGFDVYDVHPTQLPDLFARRPVVLFGKWRGEPTGTIELRGQTGNGDYNTSLNVTGAKPDEDNQALRYLWARSQIAELSDYGSGGLDPDHVKAVTALGLKYNLLTQYTSFIAVREMVTNHQGTATDVNQPLPLPVGVTDLAVGTQSGDEPEILWLMIVTVLIAAAMFLRQRRRFV